MRLLERYLIRGVWVANLYPADAVLNLPVVKHSHGLARLAAIEAPRGSFEQATAAITRATGVQIGKPQLEQLAIAAAADVDAFYAAHRPCGTLVVNSVGNPGSRGVARPLWILCSA